jgi:hypothetical protein
MFGIFFVDNRNGMFKSFNQQVAGLHTFNFFALP